MAGGAAGEASGAGGGDTSSTDRGAAGAGGVGGSSQGYEPTPGDGQSGGVSAVALSAFPTAASLLSTSVAVVDSAGLGLEWSIVNGVLMARIGQPVVLSWLTSGLVGSKMGWNSGFWNSGLMLSRELDIEQTEG